MQAVPALGARLGRSGDRWRGFGACRRGEGEAVAVVELVGGGVSVRVSSGKRARGGEREQRERKRSEGTRGVVVAPLGGDGEAGGGRGSVGARHRAALGRGEEDDRRRPGGLGRPLGPPGERQVSQVLTLSCFSITFCFLGFAICFDLVIIPNHFIKSWEQLWVLSELFQ